MAVQEASVACRLEVAGAVLQSVVPRLVAVPAVAVWLALGSQPAAASASLPSALLEGFREVRVVAAAACWLRMREGLEDLMATRDLTPCRGSLDFATPIKRASYHYHGTYTYIHTYILIPNQRARLA